MTRCHLCSKSCDGMKGLGIHLWRAHPDWGREDYYQKFLSTRKEDGLCGSCSKPTDFIDITNGYHKFCNRACAGASRVGTHWPEEQKARARVAHRGHPPTNSKPPAQETRDKISIANRGKTRTSETKVRIRQAVHRRYGTSPGRKPYAPSELRAWAYEVIRRDKGQCQMCGAKKAGKGSLHAHHILSQAKHPDLVLSVDNGKTLCKPCHTMHHQQLGII